MITTSTTTSTDYTTCAYLANQKDLNMGHFEMRPEIFERSLTQ